jgi:hypothetical protein
MFSSFINTMFSSFKHDVYMNSVYRFVSYLTKIAPKLHYENQLVGADKAVYFVHHIMHISQIYLKSAEVF